MFWRILTAAARFPQSNLLRQRHRGGFNQIEKLAERNTQLWIVLLLAVAAGGQTRGHAHRSDPARRWVREEMWLLYGEKR